MDLRALGGSDPRSVMSRPMLYPITWLSASDKGMLLPPRPMIAASSASGSVRRSGKRIATPADGPTSALLALRNRRGGSDSLRVLLSSPPPKSSLSESRFLRLPAAPRILLGLPTGLRNFTLANGCRLPFAAAVSIADRRVEKWAIISSCIGNGQRRAGNASSTLVTSTTSSFWIKPKRPSSKRQTLIIQSHDSVRTEAKPRGLNQPIGR